MFEVNKLGSYSNPTILELYKIRDEIDMVPYYQRYGSIWDNDKKRLLIDSIINGYDIPKFYFHYILDSYNDSLNSSGKKFAVIDGKQRLQTIFEFISGELILDESVVYLKDESISLNKKSYNDISKNIEYYKIKRSIDEYIFDIIHITTDEVERIEEMFLRLNEGKPVNNAEKRNAIGGHLMKMINRGVNENIFFTHSVRFGNRRMEHQDLLTKLVLIEHNESLVSFTKESLDNLIKENKNKNGRADYSFHTTMDNLTMLSRVFGFQDKLLRYKGIIPLYYWLFKNIGYSTDLYDFLEQFEIAREKNRRIATTGKANRTLLQFDRLNQQGAHQLKSLELRYQIFTEFYARFQSKGIIDTRYEMENLSSNNNEQYEEV